MGHAILKYISVWCDDCGMHRDFYAADGVSLPRDIRKHGWGLSKDYKRVYCPSCRYKHLHTGQGGACSKRYR